MYHKRLFRQVRFCIRTKDRAYSAPVKILYPVLLLPKFEKNSSVFSFIFEKNIIFLVEGPGEDPQDIVKTRVIATFSDFCSTFFRMIREPQDIVEMPYRRRLPKITSLPFVLEYSHVDSVISSSP